MESQQAQDAALAETRRLLAAGHELIVRVTPDTFDAQANDAFPPFRRGVVRAEGCREVPAEELLEGLAAKPAVLEFLATLAERKRGYRRQVENVCKILLKGPAWLKAACSSAELRKRLSECLGDEVAELLAAGPAAAAEAAEAAEAAGAARQSALAGAAAEAEDDEEGEMEMC